MPSSNHQQLCPKLSRSLPGLSFDHTACRFIMMCGEKVVWCNLLMVSLKNFSPVRSMYSGSRFGNEKKPGTKLSALSFCRSGCYHLPPLDQIFFFSFFLIRATVGSFLPPAGFAHVSSTCIAHQQPPAPSSIRRLSSHHMLQCRCRLHGKSRRTHFKPSILIRLSAIAPNPPHCLHHSKVLRNKTNHASKKHLGFIQSPSSCF